LGLKINGHGYSQQLTNPATSDTRLSPVACRLSSVAYRLSPAA
jgi:hypothetical protein